MRIGNTMNYYLAIDIGASSGRHILGYLINGIINIEEIYRFENKIIEIDGHLFWDIEHLFQEVKKGLKKAKELEKIPLSIGIDTWGVDYILLDESKNVLKDMSCYRDTRTKEFQELNINSKEIYKLTGIQHQAFNTLFQLNSEITEIKEKAKHFLMVPDYLNYLLTRKMVNEYTNMSTTQLLNVKEKNINEDLLNNIYISKKIFKEMVQPGYQLGELSQDIEVEIGFNCKVIIPATHDTGSSYMASLTDNQIILSSGTWSLLGVELDEAITCEEAFKANFTNEGGYNGKIRFLKNIMGLWLIQEVAREYQSYFSFSELVEKARKSNFFETFDVNDERFLKPVSMIKEIQNYFSERNLNVPGNVGDIAYCVYHSLALSYKKAIDELEEITNKKYTSINVIGGGCKNELLNEMIRDICQKEVIVGPVESTAIGNIVAQMIGNQDIKDIKEAKKIIKNSFEIKE